MRLTESRALTGSSSSSSAGSRTRALAIATRWRCPPDRSAGQPRRDVGVEPDRVPLPPATARDLGRAAPHEQSLGDRLAHREVRIEAPQRVLEHVLRDPGGGCAQPCAAAGRRRGPRIAIAAADERGSDREPCGRVSFCRSRSHRSVRRSRRRPTVRSTPCRICLRAPPRPSETARSRTSSSDSDTSRPPFRDRSRPYRAWFSTSRRVYSCAGRASTSSAGRARRRRRPASRSPRRRPGRRRRGRGRRGRGRARCVAQVGEQVEHLGLHRDVQGGGRLVGDEQVGVGGDRDRDEDPLQHPAGQLVRVLRGRRRPGRAAPSAANSSTAAPPRAPARASPSATRSTSASWLTDRDRRVQVGRRVLEDRARSGCRGSGASRGRPRAARSMPSKVIPSRRCRRAAGQDSEDRPAGQRLAAARLADDPEAPPRARERSTPWTSSVPSSSDAQIAHGDRRSGAGSGADVDQCAVDIEVTFLFPAGASWRVWPVASRSASARALRPRRSAMISAAGTNGAARLVVEELQVGGEEAAPGRVRAAGRRCRGTSATRR